MRKSTALLWVQDFGSLIKNAVSSKLEENHISSISTQEEYYLKTVVYYSKLILVSLKPNQNFLQNVCAL
jgi:hypothetical protein